MPPSIHPQPPRLITKQANIFFSAQDITTTTLTGLEAQPYLNKVPQPTPSSASNTPITFTSETDRVYTSADTSSSSSSSQDVEGVELKPVTVLSAGQPLYEVRREGLGDVVVWNPWEEKAGGMADFAPADGWKRMLCVEAGAVEKFSKIEGGETWEGRTSIKALL